ncbi:MAG TPA: hypothetical protein VM899_15620 [Rubellimicrobium sp.]|nr:hypothetical protein [Rubellimicrobium sp.]
MSVPSRAIALFGTAQEVPSPRVLHAGKLSAELEAGNLRYLRWDGEEVLRAISFIVRDKDWGTYEPDIADLAVRQDEDRFTVSYRALAGGTERFAYEAKIEGRADGTVSFHVAGGSDTGFLTNRTGFVILHPIDGVAGSPVQIEHTSGETVNGTFPDVIDPVQPMMDLRALTHITPGGLTVSTRMEGDTFEMEDQRNWTDASYKTYVRPLALPWPYRIELGERIDQTITVTILGTGRSPAKPGAVALRPGPALGPLPPVGIGLRPEDAASARDVADTLRALGPAHIILHHDPRAGHDRTTLEAMLEVARRVGAEPWLEAVVQATDNAGAQAEISALGRVSEDLGHPFAVVLISPAPDLKCTLPGSVWPDAPEAGLLYDVTRGAFPEARIGGGMFSFFTELNRKRPPGDKLDLISFTTSPLVHAGDDRSVMETREAYPAIIRSVTAIAAGKPWAVGPSAIGIRDNPYGAAAKDNPGNIRQAMNWNDPRQRGLLGAAWALSYLSDFAKDGAAAVTLGGATGAFGVVDAPSALPRPWFEDHGGVYPAFHVLRGLARARGATIHDLGLAQAGPVAGLSLRDGGRTEIWVANMTPAPVEVTPPDGARTAVLDAASFAAAAANPTHLDHLSERDGPLRLDAYAVVRFVTEG